MRAEQVVPYTEVYQFDEPSITKRQKVEFRLVYRGPLPASSAGDTKALAKHTIRQKLHPQLRELWHQHPMLKAFIEGQTDDRSNIETVADRFVRGVHGTIDSCR
jgi:hypothetical protein